MHHQFLVPITLTVALGTGCHMARGPAIPKESPAQTTISQPHTASLWDEVQETLRRQGWSLDRVDRQAGVVTTMPETSQHFFEVWRRDVNTRADFWEATMRPVRRWVEVQVAISDGGENLLSVIVHKERFSTLDRQFNNTGAIYQYFGVSLPATTGKEKITSDNERWVDRGSDPAMEQFVLSAILDRLAAHPG